MKKYEGYKKCDYYGADKFDPNECGKCDEERCFYYRTTSLNEASARLHQSLTDNVNSPAHYTDGKIEVIEYIEDKKLDFCLGNAIKYISRAGKKDPAKEIEDLQKAKWYIERRIKQLKEC